MRARSGPLVRPSRRMELPRPAKSSGPVALTLAPTERFAFRSRPPVLATLPAPNTAVPVQHGCGKTGDCDDNPYHKYRGDYVLTAVVGDYGHQAGDPGTDPGTRQ
jgi:hypothetical protein